MVIFFFDRLFPQLFTLGIHFLPELFSVYLGSLGYLFFLVLFLIRTSLNVSPANNQMREYFESFSTVWRAARPGSVSKDITSPLRILRFSNACSAS